MEIEVVRGEIQDSIGIIKGNNLPVNALSYSVRKGLIANLEKFLQDDSIKAIILIGEGRTFFAGADISEFGKPMKFPALNDVIKQFEDSKKPVVAALHGTPLGGGLELAMGCHYRVALKSTKMGLPEVNLGIIPGGGGTQRLPRLVGVEQSLDMITTGKPIGAKDAEDFGLINKSFDTNLLSNSIDFTKTILENTNHVRVRDLNDKISVLDNTVFEQYKLKIKKRMRGRLSPLAAVEAVEASTKDNFDYGLEQERILFKKCHDSEESSSLIHMFFAERLALKIPDIPKETETKKLILLQL